jgi:hypothetical protein
MRRYWAVFLLVLGFALPASPSLASVGKNDSFAAVKAAQPPPLDASLADPVWKAALKATNFADFTTKKPAPLATVAYLLYDSNNLYVAFRCDSTGVPITARESTDNVGMGLDDDVAVSIDTTGVGTRVYDFYATPRGVRYQDSSESNRYNPPWQASAKIDGSTWTAELIIPLKDLHGSSTAGPWRIDFQRHVAATDEDYTWAFDPAMMQIDSSQYWPALTDVVLPRAATRPQPYLDVYGLESAGEDRDIFQQTGGSFARQTPRSVGADFTYPFTDTLSAVGTVAPDFSNVEVDQQIIVPQEFQRFLSEYRPFFSQGASYVSPSVFNINDNDTLFYSPDVGTFDDGLKVEGTTGRDALGALNVSGAGFNDSAFGFLQSTPDQYTSWWANGVLANHSDGDDDAMQLGFLGLNPRNQLGAAFRVAQEWGSFVPDDVLARYELAIAGANRQTFTGVGGFYDIGPDFNPVDGFTQINDIKGPVGILKFQGTGTGASSIKDWSFTGIADRYDDLSGAAHEADAIAVATVTFKDLISLYPQFDDSELRQYDDCYPIYSGGRTLPFDQSGFGIGYKDGTDTPIDASFSSGDFGLPTPDGSGITCGSSGSDTPAFLQQYDTSTSRRIGQKLTASIEFGGTRERYSFFPDDSQWLRRASLDESLSRDADISVGYRSISGTGGFASPGQNLSLGFHERFDSQDELYINFGSPNATTTLNRTILKFVWHFGGGAGA